MNAPPDLAERIYLLILQAYPAEYRDAFGEEMHLTFLDGVDEARSQGNLGSFLLRELWDAPRVLVTAYWNGWKRKVQTGIQILQEVTSSSDLPPAPPDGRDSWRQVLFECSSFFFSGVILILVTYLRSQGLTDGWQHNEEFIGKVIIPLAVPFLILGLVRGLPRWTYPLMGLLLSYYGYITNGMGLWLILIVLLFASFTLTLATILTDPHPAQLPLLFRRIGQSLSLDWTRLTFAIYGAVPLIILMAFDDSHYNDRTPFLALSVLSMVTGALMYCRSRAEPAQLTSLLTGITLSIGFAWLDQISFTNNLKDWVFVSSQADTGNSWLFTLWIQWVFLLLFPAILVTLSRSMNLRQVMR